MRPKFAAALAFLGVILFGFCSYAAIVSKEYIFSVLALIFTFLFILIGLKHLKVIKGFNFLNPYLMKDPAGNSVDPVTDSQLGITKVNNLPLTPEQEQFVNQYSLGAGYLGTWYFIASGLTKQAVQTLIPIYGGLVEAKALNFGRRMVWESKQWQSFDEYKKIQVRLDRLAMIVITVYILIGLSLIISLLRSALR